MRPVTCVHHSGKFIFGIHRPNYTVINLRCGDAVASLGQCDNQRPVMNHANFPDGNLHVGNGRWVYEIPNPFPFKGTTFILKSWADKKAGNFSSFYLHGPPEVSLTNTLAHWFPDTPLSRKKREELFSTMPDPLKLALASTSTDPSDLEALASLSCRFIHDRKTRRPTGLRYHRDSTGALVPAYRNHALFEALINNQHLPDDYKVVMVLQPGVQGDSEIVGDWTDRMDDSHVFEYLRGNSYIPWGHFAANMAHDAIRYRIEDLRRTDVTGMRHLYYQRVYITLARELGLVSGLERRALSPEALETLRRRIIENLNRNNHSDLSCALWGWNFGADGTPTKYRLHASHQQIHQQFALIPEHVKCSGPSPGGGPEQHMPSFACGDLVADFIHRYRKETGQPFFDAYIRAIQTNTRTDGKQSGPASLIVHADENVMLFVPKAQTSQWELQLITLAPVGNILEAAPAVRKALDRAIWTAARILGAMGVKMVTVIEYSKRFNAPDTDQRILYAFLPRLPESPGAFSEAQLRWINGHYPEDFAEACRRNLKKALE